jgi:hypothetical protein
MNSVLASWRRRYGASPLHLLLHLAAFGISLFALQRIIVAGRAINFLAWFVGAAVLHDVVLLPIYSVLDHAAGRGVKLSRLRRRGVPVINHIRGPAVISGVLLLVYLPEIIGKSEHTYFNVSGHHLRNYLLTWLLSTAGLFLASGLIYAVRVCGRARPRR